LVSIGLRVRILLWGLLIGLIGWMGLGILMAMFNPVKDIYAKLDGAFYDFMLRAKPKPSPFEKLIIIDVEDGNFENSRADYARLIDKIIQAGTKVIGLDLIFAENMDDAEDDSLVQIVNVYSDKLVFAFGFGRYHNGINEAALYPHNLANSLTYIPEMWKGYEEENGAELPFYPLLTDASTFGLGHVTYYHDFDNTLRRFPMVIKYHEGHYPALALEIGKRYLDAGYKVDEQILYLQKEGEARLEIPLDENGQVLIDVIPSAKFTIYTHSDLPEPLGSNFTEAAVLVVNSYPITEWTDATPLLEVYPKWALHASLISQILNKNFITDNPVQTIWWQEVFIFLSMIWLVGFEYRLQPNRRKWWLVLLTLNIVYLAFAFIMLCLGVHLFVMMPVMVFSGTYALMRVRFYHSIKPPKYLDFCLSILERQGQRYPIQIVESPLGEEESNISFRSFLAEESFQNTIRQLRNLEAQRDDIRFLGEKLFSAIFPGEIFSALKRSLDIAKNNGKKLRLKLRVDSPELSCLPWEVMHCSKLPPGFIALHKRASLVRYLPLAQPIHKTQFRIPLRILIVISSPKNLASPGEALEKEWMQKALRPLIWTRDVRIRICENINVDKLHGELERQP